ncbi:MAG: DUF2199 domain-containing protein [Planctomycetota bacterium]|jgi:hypothetical protein
MRVSCSECGLDHDLDQMSLVAHAPAHWAMLSDEERAASTLTRDQCVVRTTRETAFFVAANLLVPVHKTAAEYSWGVWVSLSERSFKEMQELWEDPTRVARGPYFGWLCTAIPGYPDSMYLKTMVHQRAVGLRPTVELEPTDHPLAVHQRLGVDAQELLAVIHRATGSTHQ